MDIEWVVDQVTIQNKPVDLPLVFPDKEMIKTIIECAEVGSFSSIEKMLSELTLQEKYFPFNQKITKFIEKYDSSGLVNYLKSILP